MLRTANSCRLDHPPSFEVYTNSLQARTHNSISNSRVPEHPDSLVGTDAIYMALTTQDPESSGPFRILTEELAKVKRRQEIVSTIA